MSKNSKNPLMVEQKKKHHLWGLWVPLIVIFSLIIVPVGVVAVLFYEPSHYDTGITEKQDQNKLFASMMTDMFDGCRNEEPTIDLKLAQKQLNQLLYNVSSEMPEESKKYLKQFAVRIKEDSYLFDLEIGAFNIFKTHISLTTKIQSNALIETTAEGKEVRGFVFDITNLKVGRLGGLQGTLSWLTNTTGLDLTAIFQGAGLSMKMDMDNLRLTYSYDDFVNDLSTKAGTADPLFMNIFSNFFKENYISFTHNPDVDVTGTIDMTPFLENPLYTNSIYAEDSRPLVGENHDIPLLNYTSSVIEKLIDEGVIANDDKVENNSRTALKFLSYGFTSNSQEEQYIDTIYNSIKSTYCNNLEKEAFKTAQHSSVFGDEGVNIMNTVTGKVSSKINDMTPAEKASFLTKVQTEKKAYIYDDEHPLVVHDYEVQDMLKDNKQLIGYGFSFIGKKADSKTKMSYAMLDSVYSTVIPATYDADTSEMLTDDTMALTFGLNINGAKTSLVLPMEGEEIHVENKHGLTFSVTEAPLYFGTESFPNLKDQLQKIMNGIESAEDEFIQFISDEQGNLKTIQMLFDFDEYFAEHDDSDPFTKFHNDVTAAPYNARLIVDFEFSKSTNDAPGKRAGQFNIKIGYEAD